MRLEGRGVFLRDLTIEDAEEYLALRIRNREFMEPYDPVPPPDAYTLSRTIAQIRSDEEDQISGASQSFAICRSEDGAIVGRIRASNIFRGPWCNANLGYFVSQDQNGRGYATEAVRLTTGWCFDQAKLHRVQAAVLTDNPRSMRVLEKNGYRREGIALRYLHIAGSWRDHVIFAVTVEEWPS